jgi:adenosylhomocysteine nucleosidase
MVRVLVTFALAEEFAPWRKQGGFRPVRLAAAEAYRARSGDIELMALVTGAGPENAAREAARALGDGRYDLVISSGVAGGLRPEHRPGTVLAARRVRRLADGRELVPAAEWTERAVEQGAREAVFVTADHVAGTASEKRRLGETADAIEMESFAVLDAAARHGVPAAAIRAVSDPVEAELPLDFNRVFDGRGRVRGVALAGALARKPGALAGLVRLGRDTRRAAAILADFLERYTRTAAQEAAARM